MELNVFFKTLDGTTLPIYKELRVARYDNIKCWVKRGDSVINKLQARDLHFIEDGNADMNLTCYSWDIATACAVPIYEGMEHLAALLEKQKLDFVCIDSVQHTDQRFVLFLDAKQDLSYPKSFHIIPCFQTLEDLMGYAGQKNLFSFSLTDKNRFTKTAINPQKGAPVYKEIATGRLWYKDTFHRDHYEVFDKLGKDHLGEADMNGVLDTNKKDCSKHAIG